MQNLLFWLILVILEPIKISALFEPEEFDVCPADVSQLSTQGTSLLQGATHTSYLGHHSLQSKGQKVAHQHGQKVIHKAHKSHKARVHQKNHDDDEDDDLLFELNPRSRTVEAAKPNVDQRELNDNEAPHVHPKDESPMAASGISSQVSPQSLDKAHWGKPMLSNTSEDSNSSSTVMLSITTKVEKLALLLAKFKVHVHGILQGAPLAVQVAAMMTVVLGIVLLTAMTLVMRRHCAGLDSDQEEASRPAPIDKLLLHSHTVAAKSGLLQKNSDMFCPELIVPEGSECVLKVSMLPTVPDTGSDQEEGDSIFHIVDQDGKTCLCVRILSPALPGDGLRISTPGLEERIVLMSATRMRVLAYCERHGSSFHVHGQDDELFARLSKDENGIYTMVGRSGPLLLYNGQMTESSVRVSDTEGRVLAYCEKSDAGEITLRAGPLVNVGLIFCGLLALDRMEMERSTLKALTINTVRDDRQLP